MHRSPLTRISSSRNRWLYQYVGFLKVALFVIALSWLPVEGQSSSGNTVVPQLMKYSGTTTDAEGKSQTRVVGVTFALYQDREGGAPIWLETQNIQPDSSVRHTAMMGATNPAGLTPDLFASGDARWLGVQVENQPEKPPAKCVHLPIIFKCLRGTTVKF